MEDPNDPRRRRLKLFLSADIVGSTAYKQPFDISQDIPAKAGSWAPAIILFYSTVTNAFLREWNGFHPGAHAESKDDKGLFGPRRPRLWKTVGDQVVFWQELSHEQEVWTSLACWMRMISEVREAFKAREYHGLDVKSCAWIAEFPVRNKALPMHLEVSQESIVPIEQILAPAESKDRLRSFYENDPACAPVDFIGPGIDIGFRLSGFASTKKMAISLDLAYLMAVTAAAEEQKDVPNAELNKAGLIPSNMGAPVKNPEMRRSRDALRVFYSGRETLKGVLGGMKYPKFWINTLPHGTLESANDNLYARRRESVAWIHLLEFCTSVYEDRHGYLIPPYFPREDSLTRDYWKTFNDKYEVCREQAINY